MFNSRVHFTLNYLDILNIDLRFSLTRRILRLCRGFHAFGSLG